MVNWEESLVKLNDLPYIENRYNHSGPDGENIVPRVTERIKTLFDKQSQSGQVNNAELLARYHHNMECQINVAVGNGEPIEGKHNCWTDGEEEWWHIRIPRGAMTDKPIWRDYELEWSLAKHAEAIGLTGWDWANKRSIWVAFDFDSITGHAAGIGVTKDDLQNVQEAACQIPWVETRLSTRGKGLHLYVYFCDPTDPENNGVPTETHTHHQALARTVLGMMSRHAGFDFSAAIDACGGNMWVWHRDATKENHGYSQIKAASEILYPQDLPDNWEDNVEVVTRKRSKQRVRGIEETNEDDFDALANARSDVRLMPEHDEVIQDLAKAGYTAIWHQDYRLLQTHTHGLKTIMDANPGKYNGYFETLSEGTDPGTQNCFGFPLPGRGWKFYRFSKDIKEHESWERQDNGWISTFFDRKPTLDVAARVAGGSELSEGGYAFENLEQAVKTLKMLGVDFEVNLDRYGDRKAEIKVSKREGRIVLRMKQLSKDENKPEGRWNEKRGQWWETVVRGVEISSQEEVDYERWDKIVRCTSSPSGEQAGWFIHDENSQWIHHPLVHVQKVLGRHGLKSKDQDDYLGYAVQNSWALVNLPFQPEYPGKRQWNFRSAQWKYTPAQIDFDQKPHHPHWDQVLDHIGQDLETPLREHAWAQKYSVRTGRHYLQLWIASLLRHPFDKLPYLFLFSRDENTGKSTLHQAISRLITGDGVEFADRALKGDNDFNGELANCVLAVIEEVSPHGKDANRAKARMKDWTTNDYIAIRQMRTDVYRQRNTLHFIQCSNNRDDCLVSFGDTRTTMLHVPSLAASDRAEIPHAVLMQQLDAEAPHFMRTLCDMEIPPPESRLRIPFINTDSKRRFEEEQRTDLEVFLQDRCVYFPGASVPWKTFYNTFIKTVEDEHQRSMWSKRKVSMSLPDYFPTGGFDAKNNTYVGNIVLDPSEAPSKSDLRKTPLIRYKGRLRLKDDVENAN